MAFLGIGPRFLSKSATARCARHIRCNVDTLHLHFGIRKWARSGWLWLSDVFPSCGFSAPCFIVQHPVQTQRESPVVRVRSGWDAGPNRMGHVPEICDCRCGDYLPSPTRDGSGPSSPHCVVAVRTTPASDASFKHTSIICGWTVVHLGWYVRFTGSTGAATLVCLTSFGDFDAARMAGEQVTSGEGARMAGALLRASRYSGGLGLSLQIALVLCFSEFSKYWRPHLPFP